jgi:hypothetical protein
MASARFPEMPSGRRFVSTPAAICGGSSPSGKRGIASPITNSATAAASTPTTNRNGTVREVTSGSIGQQPTVG